MSETQDSIYEWQIKTFGTPRPLRSVIRLLEEVAELMVKIEEGRSEEIGSELADVDIILNGLASTLGFNLQSERDAKMEINRNRTWKIITEGHGYHV